MSLQVGTSGHIDLYKDHMTSTILQIVYGVARPPISSFLRAKIDTGICSLGARGAFPDPQAKNRPHWGVLETIRRLVPDYWGGLGLTWVPMLVWSHLEHWNSVGLFC